MSRPSRDAWAMGVALLTAQRSTCCRRHVGAVLLNERGHVLATGYNGVAAGMPHCNEVVLAGADFKTEVVQMPKSTGRRFMGQQAATEQVEVSTPQCMVKTYPNACEGANAPSGTQLDACQAIHAEQNALLQCKDIYAIHTAYVTASPCVTCCKLLLNTGCKRIVFLDEYPAPAAKQLWLAAERSWEHFSGNAEDLVRLILLGTSEAPEGRPDVAVWQDLTGHPGPTS